MGYLLPIDPIQSKDYAERDRLKIKKREIQPLQGIPRAHRTFSIHPLYEEDVKKNFDYKRPAQKQKRRDNQKKPSIHEETKGTVIDTYC